jgi:hypothetical protein
MPGRAPGESNGLDLRSPLNHAGVAHRECVIGDHQTASQAVVITQGG